MADEDNGPKGNGNWMEEHDSIQLELQRMKEELMGKILVNGRKFIKDPCEA